MAPAKTKENSKPAPRSTSKKKYASSVSKRGSAICTGLAKVTEDCRMCFAEYNLHFIVAAGGLHGER